MLDRLNNLKLRDRTLIGYSIPTLLIIVFSGMVYITSNKVNSTFEQVKKQQTILLSSKGMIKHTLNMDRRIRRYLMVPHQDALKLFEEDSKAFDELYQQAIDVADRPEDKAKLKELESLRDQLHGVGIRAAEELDKNSGAVKAIQLAYIDKSLAITNSAEESEKNDTQQWYGFIPIHHRHAETECNSRESNVRRYCPPGGLFDCQFPEPADGQGRCHCR
jgi:hypothetical protein